MVIRRYNFNNLNFTKTSFRVSNIIQVVLVAVESVNNGVDCARVVLVYETPIDTGGHGAMVIRVETVEVGQGMEKSRKKIISYRNRCRNFKSYLMIRRDWLRGLGLRRCSNIIMFVVRSFLN